MATITKKKVLTLPGFGGVPYGNNTVREFTFETNSSGVYVDSDTATAVGNGDKVRVGVLSAGMRLHDALAIVSDAFRTSSTAKIGFEYVDGVDSTDVPQDDDYFFAALAATVGRTAANNTAVRPLTLPKDAYLILTVNGSTADHASAGVYDFVVQGRFMGV